MALWRKQRLRNRQELIDRKYQLEGEIRMLTAEIRRLRSRGIDVGRQEAQLGKLRSEHHQTRLAIDRAPRD
ncbi:MAG: hypothetical protein QNJ89_00980 [Acidimicrobiia bacterium]|nr:hypothetical protein [Acidimicrobiia bacterium]